MNSESVQSYIEKVAQRFDSADLFYGHGTDNPFDEAVYLVFTLLDISFSTQEDLLQINLTQEQVQNLDLAVEKRINGKIPTAYIVGKAWFAGSEFISDSRALVPRSPIAELISNRFTGLLRSDPATVLDMCTGSGCIGIATALEFTSAQVQLVDISSDCVDLASENIALHNVEERVSIIQSDGFEVVSGTFDLILANPPYVSDAEYAELPAEYLKEPILGLVSDHNGLELPVSLLRDAAQRLNPGGVLIMEVGFSAQALISAFPQVPFLWLEFDYGGSGVFSLTQEQLQNFSAAFK